MRLLPCLKGHRVARKHWPDDQYYDILAITPITINVRDRTGAIISFPRNDQDYDWKHLGITPKQR